MEFLFDLHPFVQFLLAVTAASPMCFFVVWLVGVRIRRKRDARAFLEQVEILQMLDKMGSWYPARMKTPNNEKETFQ